VRSLGANLSTTLAATVTVLIGMFLLGLFIAFGTWVVSWSNHVKRELVVHVYYCTSDTCAKEATAAQMNETARVATDSPLVKSVVFVSKADALRIMKQTHPEEVGALPSNPFPNALTVIPKRGEDVEKVATLFKASPALGIDKVDYGKQTTHRVL
jgi:cell division protein FtsX